MSAALEPIRLAIGRRHHSEHASIAAAVDHYCALRDDSGEGASTWPDGTVWEPCGPRLRISYNGRVWHGTTPVAVRP
jgi:hypothetical protein